jgi:hypothetical protein
MQTETRRALAGDKMLIRIKARASVVHEDDSPVTSSALVRRLNGATADGVCSDYLDSDLADLGITGGVVKLVYERQQKHFCVVTEYTAPRKLKAAELKRLTRDTVGQWSDGIGEGGFDELADQLGVSIDLSPLGQEKSLRVEQIDDGRKVRSPSISLAKAARDGDLEGVRRLLDAGADPETRLQRFTALHLAILYGHREVALELIARGADSRALDPLRFDALMICATSNSMKDEDAARVARALLERGVDVHDPRGEPELTQYTPLYMAKNRKKTRLAKVLREFGATK